jgi:hypothetical protein
MSTKYPSGFKFCADLDGENSLPPKLKPNTPHSAGTSQIPIIHRDVCMYEHMGTSGGVITDNNKTCGVAKK